MKNLARFTPIEFSRKARPFCKKYKATEWSQAIRYTGLVVFRNKLSKERYDHLVTLHVAIKILSSERFCISLNAYAKSLLRIFVENAVVLYGKCFVTYNIHNLIHVADDVLRFGALQSFSAYPFENKLGKIKRLLRKSKRPLQQLVKRIAENDMNFSHTSGNVGEIVLENEHFHGPLLPNSTPCKQYSKVKLKNVILTTKTGNNCVLLRCKSVIVIENLIEMSGKLYLIGRKFDNATNLFPLPFDSTVMDIFECSKQSDLHLWPIRLVSFKMYLIPISGSEAFAAYPLENF